MARGKRSGVASGARSGPLPSAPLDRLPISPIKPVEFRARYIASLEDRRTFYPGPRPAAALPRSASRLVVSSRPKASFLDRVLSPHLAFFDPRNVALCMKRKIRREIMFAKRLRGRGAGARRRRRNEFSDVRC